MALSSCDTPYSSLDDTIFSELDEKAHQMFATSGEIFCVRLLTWLDSYFSVFVLEV
jgi:hypothetical protein